MKIGLFGGTFNPIHNGHLLLAERAREQFGLDRVLFIPAARPPHKAVPGLPSGETRLALVRLAIRGNPHFSASAIELRRAGPSYTVDTLRTLKKRHPRDTFFLLMGADLLSVRWKEWDALLKMCTVLLADRAGRRPRRAIRGMRRIAMPLTEISSSDIRGRIRRGQSVRYLVPAAVEKRILEEGLYS